MVLFTHDVKRSKVPLTKTAKKATCEQSLRKSKKEKKIHLMNILSSKGRTCNMISITTDMLFQNHNYSLILHRYLHYEYHGMFIGPYTIGFFQNTFIPIGPIDLNDLIVTSLTH